MSKAIERLEQDIVKLKNAISQIAAELQSAYAHYLSILGQILRKHLVLASYYLSTQGYPENFLKLSLNQRQQLQQSIRQMGDQAVEQLLAYLQNKEVELTDLSTEETMEVNPEIQNNGKSAIPNPKSFDPNNPIEILQWQQDLETAIQQTLKECSQESNVLLQKAGVLPKKLPESVLAAALAASEASGEVVPSPPNLLTLVIQIGHEQDPEDSRVTQIMTINLRLGEIEFADAALLSGRKQIRNILIQLNNLGREFQKKHRELKIAEAEAAWRASWFE